MKGTTHIGILIYMQVLFKYSKCPIYIYVIYASSIYIYVIYASSIYICNIFELFSKCKQYIYSTGVIIICKSIVWAHDIYIYINIACAFRATFFIMRQSFLSPPINNMITDIHIRKHCTYKIYYI